MIALLLGMLFFVSGAHEEDAKEAVSGSLIETKDSYRVKVGSSLKIDNDAAINTTFSSVDNDVVSVGLTGEVSGEAPGKAYVLAEADSGEEDPEEQKLIKVIVYPEEIRAPEVKSKEKGEEVELSWEKVPYADKYEVYKFDEEGDDGFEKIETTKDTSVKVGIGKARYKVAAVANLDNETIKSEKSEEVKTESLVDSLPSYGSIHEIRELGEDDLELVAKVYGTGSAVVPQSFSFTGEEYLITFVDSGGGNAHLIHYGKDGSRGKERKLDASDVNGSTYNGNTNRVYTIASRSSTMTGFDLDDLDKKSFSLPRVTSGIAYDSSNDKFYLSGGPKIMVTGTDLDSDKVIMKKRHSRAQDIGAYEGAALIALWSGGDTSYVDLYRVEDSSYLGSYSLPFGEIESVTADEGHLVVLMHSARFGGETGNFILKTKKLIGK